MAGSGFGTNFRITTWGETHGAGVGVVVDGCPAGLPLEREDVQKYLDRRKPGQSKYTTQRKEGGKINCQSTIQLTAVQFRNGTAVQQNIDLTETGQTEQTCYVRVLLWNIIQGIQTGQGIRQDRCILQRGIAQQMDLGADLTDTDHVSLSQSIRAAGI